MTAPLQQFGGNWTDEKLDRLRQYLTAYQQALKAGPFTRYYIDAFAGTGYNTLKSAPEDASPLLDDLVSPDTQSTY
jgi:three-Cys-motif partner protein